MMFMSKSHNKKRGQSSVEAVIVLGLVFLFMVPITLFFFTSMASKSEILDQSQTKALAQRISDMAGDVWYEGAGSRREILVSFPENMLEIVFEGPGTTQYFNSTGHLTHTRDLNSTIIITTQSREGQNQKQFSKSCPAPLRSEGWIRGQDLNLDLDDDGFVDSGLTMIVVRNEGGYVNVIRYTDSDPEDGIADY
jgi:hypothetical protein